MAILACMQKYREHTVAVADIPVAFARLKYGEAGVEPLVANDEFFALMGCRRAKGELYPTALLKTSGWGRFSNRLRSGIEAGKTTMEIEVPQETLDGSVLRVRTRCKYDPEQGIVSCGVLDVTSWAEARERLRMSEDAFRIAVEMSGKMLAVYDIAEETLSLQNSLAKGSAEPICYGDVPRCAVAQDLIASESVDAFLGMYAGIKNGVPQGSAVICMRQSSSSDFRWYQVDYMLVADDEGQPASAVLAFWDVTERRERERMQKARAERDSLTGVLNRATFEALSIELLQEADERINHAFVMADLDGFKAINDLFGHAAGDRVLVRTVKALSDALRHDDMVGRIGGDEFMVCLRGISSLDVIGAIANRMCLSVSEAADSSLPHAAPVTVSLGIALFPRDGATYEELYRNADAAMYRAKRSGGNTWEFFS